MAMTGAGAVGARVLANPRAWRSTFSALSERDYAWYFAGNIAFFMGMQMQMLLRGYLAFELTNAATALGLMAFSIAIPMLVVAPFGGVVADRVNKRTLLILSQFGAALGSLLIAVLILADMIEFWHLLATSFVTGIIFSFNMPARQALVPELVPQHKLMNAIILQMGGMNLTRVVAPALAGLLISPVGLGWVYMLTFALFLLAVASEFHLPVHGMVGTKSAQRFREDFAEGFRYVFTHRTVGLLLALGLVFPLFGFPLQQMLPVFAKDVFGKGSAGLGILSAISGVGGLVGALIAANLDRVRHKGVLMTLGGVWMGSLFVAFSLTPHWGTALLFLGMGNIGGMIFQTTNNTVIQAALPAAVRGRVMSLLMMSFGLMPLGLFPVTVAADKFGAPAAVAASSVVLVVVVVGFFLLSSRLRHLRLDPLAQAELSPVQAARLVAEGKISQEDANRLTRGTAAEPAGAAASAAAPAPVAAAPTAPAAPPEATVRPETGPEPEPAALFPGPQASAAAPRSSVAPRGRSAMVWRSLFVPGAFGLGMVLGFAASGSGEILRAWRGLLPRRRG